MNNKKSFDIVGVGELLIDFTPVKIDGENYFKENPGGAPCNYLAAAQKYGMETAFIGKVGKDAFGYMLKSTVESIGIDTSSLILSEKHNTTLAFVHLEEDGERSFSFYRKGCADIMLENNDIDFSLLDRTKAIHFGSLSFTDEPGRSTVLNLLDRAKEKGLIISYDPNYRPPLWDSEEHAIKEMKNGLKYADVLKVSDEEAELITGEKDHIEAAKILSDYGIRLVFVTLGDKGALYYHKNGHGIVEGRNTKAIDTTGAGDTFFGSTVAQIIDRNINLDDIDNNTMEEILKYSNTAASICIEGYGGIPSIPDNQNVREKL